MIVDGRGLAAALVADVAHKVSLLPQPPRLTVFTCAPNFETQKFLAIKRRQAASAQIKLEVIELPPAVTLSGVQAAVTTASPQAEGVIIQLPFPHLATTDLLPLIPVAHDVDVTYYNGQADSLLPPVVGAIDHIARVYGIMFAEHSVVVVGQGRLVGRPAAAYATAAGARVTIVTKDHFDWDALATADIVILGAGVPGLVRAEHVKDGVVIFDAGTSEEGGMLVGDADPRVAHKAKFFTPVPGGIGPLTVAKLLENVLVLATKV
jgi:methylenetetrahydrofolate dehydrogenase (NADP+)/methenyltetrahydrofolate cyclohydrolase